MKFSLTLRKRLVLLVAAAMVPLVGLSVFNAESGSDAALSRATDSLNFAVSLAASNQQQITKTAHQVLIAFTQIPGIHEGQAAPCNHYLKELKRQLPDYANLGIASANGFVLCNGFAVKQPVYVGDRSYFRDAVASGRFVAGEYIVGRLSGKPSVTFAMPILDGKGSVALVAYAAVDLTSMAASFSTVDLPAGAGLGIHDRNGILLAGTPGLPLQVGKKAASAVIQDAVRTRSTGVREGADAAGNQRLWAYRPTSPDAGTAFVVAVSMDRAQIVGPSQRRLLLELAALSLVTLLGGWVAWILGARVIVKPAARILEASQQFQQGRLDTRIALSPDEPTSEFFQIAAGFNAMAKAMQAQQGALQAELSKTREAQQKLRDAQRLARIGYWQFDLASGQLALSEEIFDFLDIDASLFEGTLDSLFTCVHHSDRPAFEAACHAAIQTGSHLDIEFRVVLCGGNIRWIHQFGLASGASEAGPSARRTGVIQDITERKLADQALASSEQRYAALFNKAPVSMWVYDTATNRFVAVNQAACLAYGYCETEFLSMSIFDIRPIAEHQELQHWLANPLRKNAAWHDLRKDGSLFAVETVSQPIQYASRDARFVIALDKTAQEKAENDVQEYLFTLQRAADAAQAITWHRTLEGTMQEIAEQARGVIGAHQGAVCLSPDSMHPQTMHALSLSEKYEAYRSLMQPTDGNAIHAMACENNRSVRMTQDQLEAHPRGRNFGGYGDKPPMRGLLAVPLLGRDGKHIGVLQLSDKYEGEFTKQDEYVVLELSHLASAGLENAKLLEEIGQLNSGLEQKVAERTAALVRQEALFRALAEQAPQMVWTASPDGRATYFNRAWFDLMGGALKDWTGYQWLGAIHPEDIADIKSVWAVSRVRQSAYAGVRRLKAQDGGFHTMAYRASPVFDDQGDVAFWVGIDADVTEIKAIETALRLSNQELEAFSYSVSHDLRGPLNTIDGFSRLLAKQMATQLVGDAGVKAGHYLMRIQAGVAQMGQLIEDLLSLSQVTRAQLHTGQVDLSLMAHQLLDEWKTREPERQVTVKVEKGLQAHGDERLLRVVMENLLANAWKFTAQSAHAEISVGQQSDLAGLPVFFIKDTGAGFDMAYADKLFQPFRRLHAASEFSGTGIGLATVSRVIKRHGGRIWAESVPARGTTFFFTLPWQ